MALSLAGLSFWYLAVNYPYPIVDQVTLDTFLPWVASRTVTLTPYKYFWPVALLYIPTVTYGLWRGFHLILREKLEPIRKLWPKTPGKINWPGAKEIGFFTLIIIGLVVNFSYNAFYQFFYNYHHLNFITGPLNDVLNGKILLVDTKAQYGFLNIFLTSWIFKAGLYFSHPNVHLISMIMGVCEYMAVYLIMRVLTKSKTLALLGIVVTTSVHFYGVFPTLFPSEFFLWPGGSVWRFLPAMPAILLFLWWSRTQKKWAWRLLQLSLAVGVLWNLESGIPLILSYWAALFTIAYLRGKLGVRQGIQVVGYTGTIMAIYSLYTYIVASKWPDWSQYYYYAQLFNAGFLQRQGLALTTWYAYWPIAIYGIVILSVMVRKYVKGGLPLRDLPVLTMLSIYGYGIFRYYLGKQNLSDLAAVSIPAIIILIYLYQYLVRAVWTRSYGKQLVVLISIAIFALPLTKFVQWGVKLEKHRLSDFRLMKYDPNFNYPPKNRLIAVENTAVPTIPITELMESADAIKKYTPNKERVAIIGYFDHVLLMQAERVNLADYYYLHATLYTKQELKDVIELYRREPKYLFVDKRVLRQAEEYRNTPNIGEHTLITIYDQVRDKFEFVEESPMMFVYKRISGE